MNGTIPFDWIEDRLRQPRNHRGFDDAEEFLEYKFDLSGYHRDPWVGHTTQKVELWVEKDALSAVFADYASDYYLTLQVARS